MPTTAHKNLTGTDLHEPKGISTASAGEVYTADGAGSGTWDPIPDVAITTKVALTAPAVDDELVIYDLSTTTNKKITLIDLLEVLNVLTVDSSPVPASDYLLEYDASAGTVKKVLISTIQPTADAGTVIETSGSWTPVLNFGGATTGITYGTQVGRYIKHGSLVTVWCTLVLTNNGSATGAATISGLPYTSSTVAGITYPGATTFNNVNAASNVMASVASNAAVIDLFKGNTGDTGSTTLTEARCEDTFSVSVTLSYRTG